MSFQIGTAFFIRFIFFTKAQIGGGERCGVRRKTKQDSQAAHGVGSDTELLNLLFRFPLSAPLSQYPRRWTLMAALSFLQAARSSLYYMTLSWRHLEEFANYSSYSSAFVLVRLPGNHDIGRRRNGLLSQFLSGKWLWSNWYNNTHIPHLSQL